MRVALLRKSYVPFGGAERHVDRFVDALLAQGHTVHLFTARWRNEAVPRDGLTIHRVPLIRLASWTEAWSFALRAPRLATQGDYDLIHSFDRVRACDLYRAGDGCHREWLQRRRRALRGIRRAVPSLNPLHLVYLTLERRLFEGGCRMVSANARRGRDEILTHYRADPSIVRVIPNGVDLARWRRPSPTERGAARTRARLAPGDRLLLLVGSGFERKGVATAIRALAAMARPGLRLAVLGSGRAAPYRRLARSLGVLNCVDFPGPSTDILTWYHAADILILPTLYDPFANVCLEAMACGVPVVTSAANGAAEALRDDVGRVVEDALDAVRFARAAETILEWGPRPDECRRAAEHYSLDRHVRETLALYDELAPLGRAVRLPLQKPI